MDIYEGAGRLDGRKELAMHARAVQREREREREREGERERERERGARDACTSRAANLAVLLHKVLLCTSRAVLLHKVLLCTSRAVLLHKGLLCTSRAASLAVLLHIVLQRPAPQSSPPLDKII